MPATKVGSYKVPYDHNGNLMHYAYPANPLYNSGVDWRDNEPFIAILTLESMKTGYSAKYTLWRDARNHQYPMFVADLLDLIQTSVVGRGSTSTQLWVVRKRSQNFGLALAPKDIYILALG